LACVFNWPCKEKY